MRKRTHCPEGHPLIGDNLILETQKGGIRQRCRQCYNAKRRRYMKFYRAVHREAFKAYRLRAKQGA
jgi:hypothetical protein